MSQYDIPPLTVGCPLYRAIKIKILKALAEGNWRYGDLIPSEKKLAQIFGVSVGTLRKAVDELVEENILTRHQGRGTFVGRHERRDYRSLFFRFITPTTNPVLKKRPNKHTARLESFTTGLANHHEQDALRLNGDALVIRLGLSHTIDKSLAAFDQVTVPRGLFCSLTEAVVADYASNLYQLFEDVFNVSVLKVQETLTSQLLGPTMASIFEANSDSAVLVQHRVAWSHHDYPVEYRTSWINPTLLNVGIEASE